MIAPYGQTLEKYKPNICFYDFILSQYTAKNMRILPKIFRRIKDAIRSNMKNKMKVYKGYRNNVFRANCKNFKHK